MKPNIWLKLNEIHQRWLTNDRTVDTVKEIIIAIQHQDKDSLRNIPEESVNGTSFYTNKCSMLNTSMNGHPACLSPRPQTPPANLYPAKSPRSPRRTFSSFDYKKDRNQVGKVTGFAEEALMSSVGGHKELAGAAGGKQGSSKDRTGAAGTDQGHHKSAAASGTGDSARRSLLAPTAAANSRGVPLEPASMTQLPRFFYSRGKPAIASGRDVETALAAIRDSLVGIATAHDRAAIARARLPDMIKILKVPLYWKQPIYLCCGGRDNKPLKVDDVINCWRNVMTSCGTEPAKFMHIMTRGGTRNYLERTDFEPLVQDVLETHPGLQFLQNSVDFHVHYINTVIVRIFFNLDRYWNDRISLAELAKSDLIWVLKYLETHDDINMVTQYFSYEHFYVIYCKFWELDTDHNLIISKADLSRHNNYALSELVISRIFSGTVLRKPSDQKTMTYPEFVWFLLAEEDKRHPRSIEYWFRLMDLDGDGVLSMYELEYFYEEQLKKMEELCIEPVNFTDCMCMMLDMIKPRFENRIMLSDLKSCRLCHIFFDTFINLPKYLDHEQRDPFNNLRDIEEGLTDISDWDRYASEAYELLVSEDGQQQAGASSDEYNYEDDFEADDPGSSTKLGYSADMQMGHGNFVTDPNYNVVVGGHAAYINDRA